MSAIQVVVVCGSSTFSNGGLALGVERRAGTLELGRTLTPDGIFRHLVLPFLIATFLIKRHISIATVKDSLVTAGILRDVRESFDDAQAEFFCPASRGRRRYLRYARRGRVRGGIYAR